MPSTYMSLGAKGRSQEPGQRFGSQSRSWGSAPGARQEPGQRSRSQSRALGARGSAPEPWESELI